jgi:ATP-dependent RNA helicase RhlE
VLQHLAETRARRGRRVIRALVLTPTRELAAQIGDSFATYGRHLKIEHRVIFGGVNENPQIRALRAGIDVLVATPGRLLDLMGRGHVDLDAVDFFVLDEADRMLDMGFVRDVRKVIAALPRDRQNLLFSATMPRAIVDLAGTFLRDPIKVEVTPQSTTVEAIDQKVMFVDSADKKLLLADILQRDEVSHSIVFTRTKHGANRLVKQLDRVGIEAAAIHGNKSQGARTRALDGFRAGTLRVLVATDIAARGIDVDDISHVFNYDLPNEPEVYVHRIGRTARAGREGAAIAFCSPDEGDYLRDIEKLIGLSIPVDTDHAYHLPAAIPKPGRRRSNGGGGGAPRRRSGAAPSRPRRRSGNTGSARPSSSRQGGKPTEGRARATGDDGSRGSRGRPSASGEPRPASRRSRRRRRR